MPEIKNPNLQTQGPGGGSGGGNDMRSTLVFFGLMLAVLVGYQFLFKPASFPAPQTPSQPAQTQTQTSQSAVPQSPSGPAQARAAATQATPAVGAAVESTTTVENDVYRIVFTNRGGQVKQWILKRYHDSAGKPLDLVQQQIQSALAIRSGSLRMSRSSPRI